MLSLQTVGPDTLELLTRLQRQPELQGLRLVGGTALALQYGHRQSVDLDFFGSLPTTFDSVELMLLRMGQCTILNRTSNILQLILNGVKVDIVNYSCYPWIDDPLCEEGLVLASPKDIAALKVNAIEGRGSKKDFIDLYALLQHYSLADILDCYAKKYPNHSIFRALLSMTYFADAEAQAMPKMLADYTWDDAKVLITEAVNQYQAGTWE